MPQGIEGFREQTKVRFIKKIRTEAYWCIYWWDKDHPCKNGDTFHDALKFLDVGPLHDHTFANHRNNAEGDWPVQCERCGLVRPCNYEDKYTKSHNNGGGCGFHIFYKEIFNTASGQPEDGDMYYDDLCLRLKDKDDEPGHCHQTHKPWTNCDGNHLLVVLPNGRLWDIDSRCSNCTLPDDTTHRCWIRHGNPELGEPVTVDKRGHTCSAGGGSIDAKSGRGPWHGFLRAGYLVR